MCLKEMLLKNVDLIHVAEDRDRWRAVVNSKMNFRFDERRAVS
jgi:hypothetical protein